MPNLVSFAASIAELAHGERSGTQSLTQSPSLFDAQGNKAMLQKVAQISVVRYLKLERRYQLRRRYRDTRYYRDTGVPYKKCRQISMV